MTRSLSPLPSRSRRLRRSRSLAEDGATIPVAIRRHRGRQHTDPYTLDGDAIEAGAVPARDLALGEHTITVTAEGCRRHRHRDRDVPGHRDRRQRQGTRRLSEPVAGQ